MITHSTAAAHPRRPLQRQHRPATLRPSWPLRLLARARAGTLNRALIAGADPTRSRALAARARLLTSARSRLALAATLERLLALAPPNRFRVRPSEEAVVANEGRLRELAALLRASTPLYARGLADVSELLADSAGPLFRGDAAGLRARLVRARASMLGAG